MAAVSSAVEAQTAAAQRVGVSVPTTTDVSPIDSPRPSASSTSLSSLGDEPVGKKGEHIGSLVDTYGNSFTPPDFTIKELRDSIPKHCFKRSALRGYAYIARDLFVLSTIFYCAYTYNTPEYIPNVAARAVLWAAYTFVQGLFATGIWVLAHECGHQAFSPSRLVNDTTGWVLHSALLVPYFSWQYSHSKHHKATGNIERDMVFVPRTRELHATRIGKLAHELGELTEETPIFTVGHLIGQQLIGWPLYLINNVTGHNYHERQREGRGKGKRNGWFGGVNHFDPRAPIFDHKEAKYIVLSDIGIAIAGTALYHLIQRFGFANMLVWYFLPYLWVNHWLVAITFLQHTDPSLPHYTAETWDFVRGAAATIDREMGFIGRHILHGIAETHVLHHYISTIPFYNADEATESIKKVMGNHYRSDTRFGFFGFVWALWTSSRRCQWVEPSRGAEGKGKGVLFFRNSNGFGPKPLNSEEYKAMRA